jgi:hypothetical protein
MQNTLGLKEYKDIVKGKKKRSKAEENLQLSVCEYIRTKYPTVIFMCDLASGMKMPIWMAARNKKMRSSSGLPDLFIAKENRGNGLFIELKKEGTKLMKKDGKTPATPHLAAQAEILARLSQEGYCAVFCVGYDEAVFMIDAYLK